MAPISVDAWLDERRGRELPGFRSCTDRGNDRIDVFDRDSKLAKYDAQHDDFDNDNHDDDYLDYTDDHHRIDDHEFYDNDYDINDYHDDNHYHDQHKHNDNYHDHHDDAPTPKLSRRRNRFAWKLRPRD
jgi:hypothetical protein